MRGSNHHGRRSSHVGSVALAALLLLASSRDDGGGACAFSTIKSPSSPLFVGSRTGVGRSSSRLWSSTAIPPADKAAADGDASSSSSSSSSPSDDDLDHHGAPDHREYVLDLTHYRTVSDFNAELDVLSRRCSDDVPGRKEDVIGCAALAEDMLNKWEEKVREAEDVADEAEDGAGEEGVAERIRADIVRPDVTSYNLVIRAWSKACSSLAEGRGRGTIRNTIGTADALSNPIGVYSPRDAAVRAQSVLNDVENRYLDGRIDVAPVASSYNAVIDAWAKSRCDDASERAEGVLERMKRLSEGKEEASPEGRVNAGRDKWERAAPDIVSYNSVMEAWAHSSDPDALRKARNALEMLQAKYDRTGDPRIKPNVRTVNQVINCYAKRGAHEGDGSYGVDEGDEEGGGAASTGTGNGRGDERAWSAARRAERLLNDMSKRYEETSDPDFKPDAATYTSCCDAYGRVGDVAASERAESLLNRIERTYNETGDADVRPNYRTYTAVIGGWAKTRDDMAPHRAERILSHMERLHAASVARGEKRTGRGEGVKPNSRTYTTVINAWVRSRDKSRAQRALRILKKMIDLYKNGDASAAPTIYAYNAVMEGCAKCRGTGEEQVRALKIAFAVNKALGQAKGVEPNHVTYCILMKCVQKLLPAGEERNKVARAVFDKCREAGLVDPSVMRQLQMAADRDLFYELCESITDLRGHVNFDDIPQEWKRNVR